MITHWIVTLLWAGVILGAIYQMIKPGNQAKANTLIAAGPEAIGSLTKGLRGPT